MIPSGQFTFKRELKSMLELVNLNKQFGTYKALNEISLTFNEGEFFSLLGPSGCGKSTLLRMIAGFEEPTSGTIVFNGQEMTPVPAHLRPFNMIFQKYALFPHLSVYENVAFSLTLKKTPSAEIRTRVKEALDLSSMASYADRYPSTLSGGQQQRVAIARAIAARPKILLLDEPLSALDLKLRLQMQSDLKALQRHLKMTFIFVTHDQTEAMTMSDRIGVMAKGNLVEVGSPAELYHRPRTKLVAEFIGSMSPLPIISGVKAGAQIRPEKLRLSESKPTSDDMCYAEGTLTEIIDRGSTIDFIIKPSDLSESMRSTSLAGMLPSFRPGQNIWCTWRHEDVLYPQGDSK